MYINEIIRVTYKCNWKCNFCNVREVNNFGENDISSEQVIKKILGLTKKYNKNELKEIYLSFSGGEPTLNSNLGKYISLAKHIGINDIEIQTNGSIIFNNFSLLESLVDSGLKYIFLGNHSEDMFINKELGCFFNKDNFIKFVNYYKNNKLSKKIAVDMNIVISKINIFTTLGYLNFLYEIGFLELLKNNQISIGMIQLNGYAWDNREKLFLDFNEKQIDEIKKIVDFLESKNIKPTFHYTSPPLCILNFPKYNLEYFQLKTLNDNAKDDLVINGNLDSMKYLWREKEKISLCKKCKYNPYCSGFYKSFVNILGKNNVTKKVKNYLLNNEYV